MTFKITVLCGLLLCGVLSVDSASECNKCMEKNYAKCLNSTSYQLCTGTGTPIVLTELSDVYNCGKDEVCTDSENICESDISGAIAAPCGDGSGVCISPPICKAGGEFHCTGPSEYIFCTSATSSLPQTCPDGEFCSELLLSKVNEICATESVLTALEIEPSCEASLRDPNEWVDRCWAAKKSAPGATVLLVECLDHCTKYIYCERKGNKMVGLPMSCSSGSHFDDIKKECVPGPCQSKIPST